MSDQSVDVEGQAHPPVVAWREVGRIALVLAAAGLTWFHVWEPLGISVIGIIGVVVGAWPIAREACESLMRRRMTMELSMVIAIVAAAAISDFFTALVITLFALLSEALEGLTVSRGRRAIRDLLDILPHVVAVRRSGQVLRVPADRLARGDSVLVAPGERIPVDGPVLAGHSFVDQSQITGESVPAEKDVGDHVYAGSINQTGTFEIRADRIGRDTSFGKIVDAIEQAERSRAPVQRIADRLAGYLVYFALGAAAVTWWITFDIKSTISVVIVAGACGIAVGTPLAVLGAIGRAARGGAIIKGGLYLEQLGRIDTVVFDKTGTLTVGRPMVSGLFPSQRADPMVLLDVVAAAESRSEHPLGKAIVAYAVAQSRTPAEPEQFNYYPGRGVAAVVSSKPVLVGSRAFLEGHGVVVADSSAPGDDSLVYAARDGQYVGSIAVSDQVRPDAERALAAVHALGVRTVLLTGDTAVVAHRVARAVGIADVQAAVLPDQKRRFVSDLVEAGHLVAMVGDGVNDAPALTAAQVGIAMGSGTDVARESANVVLLNNDLSKVAETLKIARRARRTIWVNFAGTLAVDLCGIALAAAGLLDPMLAAFIHVSSETIFILNAARLIPARIRKTPGAEKGSGASGSYTKRKSAVGTRTS
ncbi:MAG TPA: cation-translocating P-type ATPase [Nevskiaceae bacterium]|nr:cation-translocating P-type ATPase [Nevskiaceae bacterium]